MKIKNIVILAGGESRRFWPLEDKVLIKFLGKEFLLYQIEAFLPFAEKLWVVAKKELSGKISKLSAGIKLIVQNEDKKGQAGALLSVLDYLDGEVLVVNGNDYFDEKDIKSFFEFLKKEKPEGVLSYTQVKKYFPGGYLKFDKKGRIVAVVEKPKKGEEPSDKVKAVLDYFSSSRELKLALEKVSSFDFDEQYERAITILLKDKNFQGFLLKKGFLSLKYPWDVLKFMEKFLSSLKKKKIYSNVKIGEGTIIQGAVFIEEGVKIGSFCKLKGPLFIGKNTIIGDYVLLRDSHIGEKCLIGAHSEIARSYLDNEVSIHRAYVGDSVVAEKVMFGAGSITANYRFDENTVKSLVKGEKVDSGLQKLGAIVGKTAKVGSGVILLPGVKIGKKSWIGPGEVVKKDIEDEKFIFVGTVVKNKFV